MSGLHPYYFVSYRFLQRCQSYAAFLLLYIIEYPIGLANLFANITIRRSIHVTMQYPQASSLEIFIAFWLRSFLYWICKLVCKHHTFNGIAISDYNILNHSVRPNIV